MVDTFQYDVFISHSSKDKPVVLELANRLKKDGLQVWLDEWEIQPGDPILLKIEQGLEKSRTLILAMSQNAFESDWVTLERHTLLFRDPTNAQRRFIPLLIEDCKLPDLISQFAYIDWRKKSSEAYSRLLCACSVVEDAVARSFLIKPFIVQQNESTESKESIAAVKTKDGERPKVLPYSELVIGKIETECLIVDILARIIPEEEMQPDVSPFLKRITIDKPFCPKCSRTFDIWRGSWMIDGVQIGYECKGCQIQRNGNRETIIDDAKAEVRKKYDHYWGVYKDKILKLTHGKPEKYRLP